MANWYEMLKKAMADDDFDNKICTLTDEQLKREFNNDWRCSEGTPFTAWSVRYVYFPVVYEDIEWICRAPRNPCDEALKHQVE